jgi:biotin carboxyl carrier protein
VTDAEVVAIMQQEDTVFRNRRDALVSAEQAMRREMALIRKELVQLNERTAMQREAVGLAGETLAANEDLVAKGFVSRQRVLELKRAQVAEESSFGAIEADRLRADQRLADLSRRMAELRNRFLENVAQELKASDERLHQLEQTVTAQQSEVQRDSITAPMAGTVMNLRSLSIGRHRRRAAPDRHGDRAVRRRRLRRGARRTEGHPLRAGGRPRRRAGDRLEPPHDADAHRRRRLRVARRRPRPRGPHGVHRPRLKVEKARSTGVVEPLKPGMQTIVYLRTPSRTVLDYLLEPLIDSMRTAFREPT